MSAKWTAPKAQPVRLGVQTAVAQYDEITPLAAMREIPDNVLGISAGMTGVPRKGVPFVADIQEVFTRSGIEEPRKERMLCIGCGTRFSQAQYDTFLSVINPKADDPHIAQVHAMGTSNATIALGGSDCSGQSLVIARWARAEDDPVRPCYPVKMKAQRYGGHANLRYAEENPGTTGRATVPGQFMVYRDPRTAKFPFMGAFVASSGGAVEPTTTRAFKGQVLSDGNIVNATRETLLDDSKWARNYDGDEGVLPEDQCDNLISDVHDVLKRMAQASNQSYEEVFGGDSVVYFFWGLRDEVQQRDGVIYVNGTAMHEWMADAYLPVTAPTRAVLSNLQDLHMPDPMRTHMVFGSAEVDFESHWLLAALARGDLVPVSYAQGKGDGKRVFMAEGFAVESYTCKASELLKGRSKDSAVVVHMRSGLAVGDRNAYLNGRVVNSVHHGACAEAARDLRIFMEKHSLGQWPSKSGENLLDRSFAGLVPGSRPWTEGEGAAFTDAIAGLVSIHSGNAKLTDAEREAAAAKARAGYDAWFAGSPNATDNEKAEKEFEFACRSGGAALQTALKQVGYIASGRATVHIVTVYQDTLAVDKSKVSILGESGFALRIGEELPRRDLEIMLQRCEHIAGWQAEHIAEEKRLAEEERGRRERKEAEDAEERRQGQQALREKKEADKKKQAQRDQASKVSRMNRSGCCPQRVPGREEVRFMSLNPSGTSTMAVAWLDPADAEAQLRAGTLKMVAGRGKGKHFIFSGARPQQGRLFTLTGSAGTEVVVNPNPPTDAATATTAAAATRPPERHGRDSGARDARQAAATARVEVPAQPDGERYRILTKRVDDGSTFSFAVPVPACTDQFVADLTGTTHNPTIARFISGVRAVKRLAECFEESGGMPLMHATGERTRLRIVPMLRQSGSEPLPPAQSQTVEDAGGFKIWTIFMDVGKEACQQRIAKPVPEVLKPAYLGYKIARAALNAYRQKTMPDADRNYEDALMGLLLADSFTTGEYPVAPHVGEGGLEAGDVPVSALGKRKARNEAEQEAEQAEVEVEVVEVVEVVEEPPAPRRLRSAGTGTGSPAGDDDPAIVNV